MAEEFYTGAFTTMSWWNTSTAFDTPSPLSFMCSTAIGNLTHKLANHNHPHLRTEYDPIQIVDSSIDTLESKFFDPIKDLQSSWAMLDPEFLEVPTLGTQSVESTKVCSLEIGSDEPPTKKPRIQMPSPLPTFKVRKEKLGDRISALQQLVSPFGKTDTASVLHEAIEYIKFLHDQVNVLSTPYLKNNGHHQMQQKENNGTEEVLNQSLKSRGLCLVPISSTFALASECPMDFWSPSFGGSYQ